MVLPITDIDRLRSMTSASFTLRRPRVSDGRSVHALIAACQPLDRNSLYLNLLQCTHFAETCVLAEPAGRSQHVAGFVSGYLIPQRPATLFIWQVAIDAAARGHGLAKRMLLELLKRTVCQDVTHIETTITQSNEASWALFGAVAKALDAPLEQHIMFDRDQHLDGAHESEVLVTIGPFLPPRPATA